MSATAPPLSFQGRRYRLTFHSDRPSVSLDDAAGNRLADLFVLSSVNAIGGRDDTTSIEGWEAGERGDESIFTLRATSSVWASKLYTFRCSQERVRYVVTVEGEGSLDEVTYFGGYSSAILRWGSGFFPSGQRFKRGFTPEPNAENRRYFPANSGRTIDLVGGPLPGRRHWFFNPAPFCFSFEGVDSWVGIGVEASAGEHGFTEYRYHGGDGFWLSLAYEGYTQVAGRYELPGIGFDFGDGEYDALGAHVEAVRAELRCGDADAGMDDGECAGEPDWWRRAIFCGWGAQCALAAREHGYRGTDPAQPEPDLFLKTMQFASSYARQDAYEAFLEALTAHDVCPGTITIDDKWQRTYGENLVDEEKWPDLRGFIDQQHAERRRVLLWLKAWDREGVPDDECIRNAAGVPLTIDPTNPRHEARLRASIRTMLGPDGYDADGFKIDFTHRMVNGPGMQLHGDVWGLELMRYYLAILHEEAHRTKPDALVITHTPHPYLNDVLDMVRLNDMVDLTEIDDPEAARIDAVLTHRARVARIACPGTPIDTDNWPVRNKENWREYLRLQPELGVPSLYFATHIDLTQEPLDDDDYRLVRETWQRSRQG